MKNRLILIVTSVLLQSVGNAMAGLLSSPMGVVYTNPELAPSTVQQVGNDTVRIHTRGLSGEWTIRGSDFPPEYDIATTATLALPFWKEMELLVDVAEGTVSGRSTANLYDKSSPYLAVTAEVRGNATCIPLHGLDCGQLVVELELRGALSDPTDPTSVGRIQMQMLGSMVWDGDEQGYWAAMSANATLGVNEVMANSIISMAKQDVGYDADFDIEGNDWFRQPPPVGTLSEHAVQDIGYEADYDVEGNDWFQQPSPAGTLSEHAIGYEADYGIEGNDWFQQPLGPVSSSNEGL